MMAADTERLISGKYAYGIWRKYIEAAAEYKLISNGDRIAVCISGGKDSMLLAKLIQMTQKYKMYDITAEYIMMNPGYNAEDKERVLKTARELDIPLEIFDTDVFENAAHSGGNPCFICSRMRRGYLYRRARELGCNKIALGHHYNDVIETILMGMLYGSQIQTMLPVVDSRNVEGMKLIRPMYHIKEKYITDWSRDTGLDYVKCSCGIKSTDGHEDTKRYRVKQLIRELSEENPAVEANIFGSVKNIDLTKIISCRLNGSTYSILDTKQKEG